MSNTELIKELRSLTQAGMKDCKDALEEAEWNLQKAVDIVKTKGLNIVSGRDGKIAAEGKVLISELGAKEAAMVEVNCQTDFVANSNDFAKFVELVMVHFRTAVLQNMPFNPASDEKLEEARKSVVASTKENIVVRRWWVEQSLHPNARTFSYIHNNKIGVVLSLLAPNDPSNCAEFFELGNNLAMQVAAMNPIAVSSDRISHSDLERQKAIFDTQIRELNKPQAAQAKIMEGKMNKWYNEVCLLDQECIVLPKKSVRQLVTNVSKVMSPDTEIQVLNFVRCQVGEGIEKIKSNFEEEVSKMSGVPSKTELDLVYGRNVK